MVCTSIAAAACPVAVTIMVAAVIVRLLHVVLVLAAAAVARVLLRVHLLHRRPLRQRPRRLQA